MWCGTLSALTSPGVGGTGLQATVTQPHFGIAVPSQQVHDDAPEDGEVLRCVVDADATLVFSEAHIQCAVHRVLNAPVRAHRVCDACRVGRQARHGALW